MVSYKNRSVVGVRLSALVCLSSIIFSLNLGRRAEDSSRMHGALVMETMVPKWKKWTASLPANHGA